ncbi:hypothetical protein PGQ11_013205 [Apiospora arundinis]|uniref:DUF7918 domain-containing protein n=1 Tax=Apiospora arundinis TaxID=335852 RepID=A0ABR2I4J6_9PEZI
MAILNEVPGLEVTIQMDGYNVREYTDPYDKRDNNRHRPRDICPRVVKYIESKTGASFAVCFLKDPDFKQLSHHIAFRVHVDSVEAGFFHEPNNFTYREWGVKVDGGSWKSQSGITSYKFRFGDFDVLPNDEFSLEEIETHKKEASKIGTIKISVYDMEEPIFVEAGGGGSRGRNGNVDNILTRQDYFAEKAVKGDRALTHSVDFGDRREKSTSRYDPSRYDGLVKKSVWADPKKRPFAEFEFRYRSLEGLKQEAIVSRTDDMDDEEVREYAQNLERDHARLQAQAGTRKRGVSDDHTFEQNKRARMDVDPEVIDLTQDDEDDAQQIQEDNYWW